MRNLRGVSLAVVALGVATGLGAKPGGGGGNDSDSFPPVAPAYNFAAFQDQPSLGGVLDTETNIVWGYSMAAVEDIWNYSYASNANTPGRYPATFEAAATYHEDYAQYCLDQAATDPDRAHLWEELAAEHAAKVGPLRLAGSYAVQFDDWRLPTVEEARAAIAKGIFTGPDGLNLWKQHPADAVCGPPRTPPWYWTSTYGGKARGGFDTAWTFNAVDGSARTTTGFAAPIMVRTHTPPPAP